MQQVINGNNIDVLKSFPDNHFDAVVTDPPYGLGKEPDALDVMQSWVTNGYHEVKGSGFMGKEWDAFVPQPNFWREVFRVLKPGGHVLSFFGTRTYDWGVMAIRFAGFEVRDTIQWHYGSGFPKSHNISKAIDKLPKANDRLIEFSNLLKTKRLELGLSISDADNLICDGSTMYHFLEGRTINGVLKIYPPNKVNYEKIKQHFNIVGWEDVIQNNLLTIGIENGNYGFQKNGDRWIETRDVKIATTEQAKQWDGWGSALKPATEPIVLARKPLEKGLSIAENVLKYGTGGINIDGCRVGNENRSYKGSGSQPNKIINHDKGDTGIGLMDGRGKDLEFNVQGRFPANLIMSHHPECECVGVKKVKSDGHHSWKIPEDGGLLKLGLKQLEDEGNKYGKDGKETVEDWNCHPDCPIRIMDEQSLSMGMHSAGNKRQKDVTSEYDNSSFHAPTTRQMNRFGDTGGASRFFYCAKASKSERNKGLDEFDVKIMKGRDEGQDGRSVAYKPRPTPIANIHPTVKPIKLMQYLVRLITPPSGIVLDPFCGSGTTGIACRLEGFHFIGIEQDAEYCKIAEARINNYVVEEDEIVEDTEKVKKPAARQKKSENNSEISTIVKDKNPNLVAANQLKLF